MPDEPERSDDLPSPGPRDPREKGDVDPRDVNPEDRFSVSGKPLTLDEFAEATMGDIAGRPLVEPEDQPDPQPREIILRGRRPAENPAEADWEPEAEDADSD